MSTPDPSTTRPMKTKIMKPGAGGSGNAQTGGTGSTQRVKYLERLRKISHQIHSAENLDEILINLRNPILSLLDAQRVTIYAVDKVKREIYSKYKLGDEAMLIRVPINKLSIAGYVAATGSNIAISDAYNDIELLAIYPDLKFDRSWDKKTGFRTKQVIAYPLMHEKFLMGVIQVINKKSGDNFTNADRNAIQEIAEVLGLALYNHQKRSVKYKTKFDWLLHNNHVTKEDLDKAIREARLRNWPLEEVLIKITKISKENLLKSLSAYFNLPFFSLYDSFVPSLSLVDRLNKKNPFSFLEANGWVPFREEDKKLHILVEDPSDQAKVAQIPLMVRGGKFEMFVGLKSDVNQLISKLSGQKKSMVGREFDDSDLELTKGDESATDKEFQDEGIVVEEGDSGVVKLVNFLLVEAYNRGVSDIHVETYPGKSNTIIRYRQDGACYVFKEIPANWKKAILARIKIMSNLNIAERRLPQDGKIQLKHGDKLIEYRVATLPTYGGNEDAVLRILAASEPLPLDRLNLSARNMKFFLDAVAHPYGIFLCVGPTGSGKTTTLHSALGHINTPERKIWTAEDPVEITQRGLRQVQMHRQIDLTFAVALKAFLRADPDVIMIGEMRDFETANMGIEASLTGHLVFSTLHTNSAPETVTRLIDLGLDPLNFADAFLGVLAQRLVRTLCPFCKQKVNPTKEELAQMSKEYGEKLWPELKEMVPQVNICKPKGCEKCNNTGLKGRTGLHEIMNMNLELKKLIQKKATVEEMRDAALRNGMRTLKQDGIWKVLKGDTTMELVRAVAST
ncbi:MAG: ATPase, T2SS/T4P/T4SS family [Nitrospinota bacterium]|nr:ATPase, T2SS/T4P/T4SS family [Nitrospinota bacterium]